MAGAAERLANTARLAIRAGVERRVPFWPAGRIERLQCHRVRSIVRHAFETVPFYRAAMAERGLTPGDFRTAADLERLPLIDGAFVRSRIEPFLSSGTGEASRVAMKSGGSAHAGVRTVVHWDAASQLRKLAIAERDRAVVTAILGRAWGISQLTVLPEAAVSLKVRAWWDERIVKTSGLAVRHAISAERSFEEAADRIDEVKPDIVYSFGSYADLFFRHLATRGRRLSAPRLWLYGGDMLHSERREWIEREFGILVTSTYQTVETGRLGFECELRRGFHLNVDLCAVRLIDAGGGSVAPGVAGELVVSNLFNRAMILLNYRLGDRGVLAVAACPCGRGLPLLERLEGRVSEVLRLADGREIPALVFRNQVREELAFAFQCQIDHPGPGRVVWRIVPLPGADREAAARALLEKSREVLGEATHVAVELVAGIPLTPGGKHLDVVKTDRDAGRTG